MSEEDTMCGGCRHWNASVLEVPCSGCSNGASNPNSQPLLFEPWVGVPPPFNKEDALNIQVGGGHYKDLAIQPVKFCQLNQLNFCEAAVVKYVCRHHSKGGRQDIEKAIHFLNLLLELEYGDSSELS